MKKLMIAAVAVLGMLSANAQDANTSIVAGYTASTMTAEVEVSGNNGSADMDASGFFVGLTHDIAINDEYTFTPGIIYTSTEFDDMDDKIETLQIPLFIKRNLNDKFALLAGPKLDYILNTESSEDEFVNDLALALGLGLEFNITEQIALVANYSFQLTNSLTSEGEEATLGSVSGDASVKFNYLNIGLAYKF
ncbi:porin family protein [Flavobacteriaceae bacterium]|nr:porin family protein [Flavobacteriaceae bacterium]